MVEAGLASVACCQESQVNPERANERFCLSWSTVADVLQNNRSDRGGRVLAGIQTECGKHSLQQLFVATDDHWCQSPMLQEPLAQREAGRRSLRN